MNQAARIEQYVQQLNHRDRDIRFWAASALGQIGEPALEALHLALRNPDRDVRYWAARCLGRIRSPQSMAALQERLQDETEDEMVRRAAAWALAQIDPQRAN
jgi:HEAT repeat protein